MKGLFVIALSCLVSLSYAQKKSGIIQYKETIKLDIDMSSMKDIPEAVRSMIPTEQSVENTLYFTANASLYTNAEAEEDEGVDYKSDDNSMQIDIQMDMPEHQYYHDLKTAEVVESQDLFGKKFLITGSQKMKWKLSNETKEVLGYTCKKATLTEGDKQVEAWYTSEIPVSIGPANFHDLPGAVLAVNQGAQRTIIAINVEFKKVDNSLIVKPKKGKKVTSEQFKKIAEEKAKEMAEMYGGNGTVIMKTETIER